MIYCEFKSNSEEGWTSVEFFLHTPRAAVLSNDSKNDSARTKAMHEILVGFLFLLGLTISIRV